MSFAYLIKIRYIPKCMLLFFHLIEDCLIYFFNINSSQEPGSPRSPNGFYYPAPQHHHYGQQTPGSPHTNANMQPTYGTNNNYGPPNTPGYPPANNGYNGNATSHHYNGGSGTGPYIAPHRGMPPPIGMFDKFIASRSLGFVNNTKNTY